MNWNLIFSGFTALGTVGSVITSLWLARKGNPKLRVSATKRLIIQEGGNPNVRPTFVVLEVTNIGGTPLNLIQFIWKVGFVKKTCALQRPDDTHEAMRHSHEFPKILYPGEQARWFLEYNSFVQNNFHLFSYNRNSMFGKIFFWLGSPSWEIGIDVTGRKEMYWSKINKDLRRDISSSLKNKNFAEQKLLNV